MVYSLLWCWRKGFTNKTHLLTLFSRILEQKILSSCLTLSFFKGQLELNTRKVFLKTQKLKKNQKAGVHIPDSPKFLFNQPTKPTLLQCIWDFVHKNCMQTYTEL